MQIMKTVEIHKYLYIFICIKMSVTCAVAYHIFPFRWNQGVENKKRAMCQLMPEMKKCESAAGIPREIWFTVNTYEFRSYTSIQRTKSACETGAPSFCLGWNVFQYELGERRIFSSEVLKPCGGNTGFITFTLFHISNIDWWLWYLISLVEES